MGGQLPFWKGGRSGKGRPRKSSSPKGAFRHCSETHRGLRSFCGHRMFLWCETGYKTKMQSTVLSTSQLAKNSKTYRLQATDHPWLPLPSHLFSREPHPQAQVACLVAVEIRYQRVTVATRVVVNKSFPVLADPSTLRDQHRLAGCSVTLLPHVDLTGLAEFGQIDWRKAVKFSCACCLSEKSS